MTVTGRHQGDARGRLGDRKLRPVAGL